jgi:Cu-Zn family superoxide dismutase
MASRAYALPFLLTAALSGCAAPADSTAGSAGSLPPGSTPWLVSGDPPPAVADSARSVAAPQAPSVLGTVSGTFLPYPDGIRAVTYDPKVVPPGATAQVTIARTAQGTTVRLRARGLVPRRSYGAHLHTRPCTAAPDEAGPHYQHNPDPEPPSVDPAYANPRNEVWLDFTADTHGGGSAASALGWTFDEVEPPRSMVVHAGLTRTGAGEAGTAGPRVACLTLARR